MVFFDRWFWKLHYMLIRIYFYLKILLFRSKLFPERESNAIGISEQENCHFDILLNFLSEFSVNFGRLQGAVSILVPKLWLNEKYNAIFKISDAKNSHFNSSLNFLFKSTSPIWKVKFQFWSSTSVQVENVMLFLKSAP